MPENNAAAQPPEPKLVNQFDGAGAGKWYAGAVPAAIKSARCLVFVPGLGDSAATWWGGDEYYGRNDMYASAFGAGYRTAFVSFAAPGVKPGDMWRNGSILSWQINEICRYYGVPWVTLIAHSKGGVDSEAAAVYYGAGPYVEKLITLSSPHWGSQLADLAYSTAGWHLADRLGMHSDGCYAMQTEYMKKYRGLTAQRQASFNRIITFAGDARGPAFTPVWAGSFYMDRFGENDGVVSVRSARHPEGDHLGTLNYNHSQMHIGRFAWNYILSAVENRPVAIPAIQTSAAKPGYCGHFISGGVLERGVNENIVVDTTVEGFETVLYVTGSSAPGFTSPGGSRHDGFQSQKMKNGTLYKIYINNPEKGVWKLTAGKNDGAYFTCTHFFGSNCVLGSGDENSLMASAYNARAISRIIKTYPESFEFTGEFDRPAGIYSLEQGLKQGLYNIETRVTGELDDGCPFCRTLVRPFTVSGGTQNGHFNI